MKEPIVLLLTGLAGAGKSTVANSIAEDLNFIVGLVARHGLMSEPEEMSSTASTLVSENAAVLTSG